MPTIPPITLAFTPGLAVAGAAAMAVPIVIHLLSRLRRKREPWGAMKFLMAAFRKHRRRLQLEQLILLAVRCLILVLLGLALAGPTLGGLLGRLTGGLDASGRLLILVMDDSLTTRAGAGADARRFDALRDTALQLTDGLGPGDRVALIRAATPIDPAIVPATLDLAEARRKIAALQPRYSGADLPAALAAADAMLDEARLPADRAFVAVLSDWSRSTLNGQALGSGPPQALADLGTRARVVVASPVVGAGNVQIATALPRQGLIVGDGRSAPVAIPVEVQLRRFSDDPPAASSPLALSLLDAAGRPIGEPTRRVVRWSAGQTVASVNIDLPLSGLPVSGGGATLALAARLEETSSADALDADDRRYAVVEWRPRLNVAVLEAGPAPPATDAGLTPAQWLGLALAPGGADAPGVVEAIPVTIDRLDEAARAAARTWDAALVARPDLLDAGDWQLLAEVARRGGLVWVVAPPSHGGSTWGQQMASAFELAWQVGLEAVDAPPQRPWALDGTTAVPEPLNLLAADWADLLRPVQVTRRLDVAARGGEDTAWLTLDGGEPLLVAADVGEGKLVLLATALDPDWTNLPTKPLFVPLLHETLRAVLGGGPAGAARRTMTVGAAAALGPRWAGVASIAAAGGDESVALTPGEAGPTSAAPLQTPGLWVATGEAMGRALAVNVDADAGDTRSLDAAELGQWLGGLGPWSFLDPNDPVAALTVERRSSDLGWPLLWIVVGLALLETFLARRFSHAEAAPVPSGPASLLRRAIATLHEPRRAA